MEDRFTPGLFAGLIGDIVLQIYFFVLSFLNIIDRTYVDYGKILTMAKPYEGVLAFIIGTTFEVIIGGLLGVFLSYLLKYTTNRFYLFKAISVGATAWLFFLVPGTLYRLPLFGHVPPKESFLMLIGSIAWSITAVFALKYLTKGFKVFYTE